MPKEKFLNKEGYRAFITYLNEGNTASALQVLKGITRVELNLDHIADLDDLVALIARMPNNVVFSYAREGEHASEKIPYDNNFLGFCHRQELPEKKFWYGTWVKFDKKNLTIRSKGTLPSLYAYFLKTDMLDIVSAILICGLTVLYGPARTVWSLVAEAAERLTSPLLITGLTMFGSMRYRYMQTAPDDAWLPHEETERMSPLGTLRSMITLSLRTAWLPFLPGIASFNVRCGLGILGFLSWYNSQKTVNYRGNHDFSVETQQDYLDEFPKPREDFVSRYIYSGNQENLAVEMNR